MQLVSSGLHWHRPGPAFANVGLQTEWPVLVSRCAGVIDCVGAKLEDADRSYSHGIGLLNTIKTQVSKS